MNKPINNTFSDQIENCKTNCKPSSSAMFDNADSQIQIEQFYPTQQQAEQTLATLIKKAKEIENEPCQITHHIQPTQEGVILSATFTFSCQAEAVIFQMKLR